MDFEDIKLAVTPYLEKLAGFETAEQIRSFMVNEEVKAIRRRSDSCAVAEYVRRESGQKVSVRGGAVHTPCRLLSVTTHEDGEEIKRNTPAMREFILNFDNGDYPELVDPKKGPFDV